MNGITATITDCEMEEQNQPSHQHQMDPKKVASLHQVKGRWALKAISRLLLSKSMAALAGRKPTGQINQGASRAHVNSEAKMCSVRFWQYSQIDHLRLSDALA